MPYKRLIGLTLLSCNLCCWPGFSNVYIIDVFWILSRSTSLLFYPEFRDDRLGAVKIDQGIGRRHRQRRPTCHSI